MGLSKSGLTKNGGKIRVENKVGEGRIFTFVLPLDPKDHIMTGDKSYKNYPLSVRLFYKKVAIKLKPHITLIRVTLENRSEN